MNTGPLLVGTGLLMLAVMATAAVIARYSPFFRRELAQAGNRDLSLDGLRGMAALAVAMHHAALFRTWLTDGEWGHTHSSFLQALGPGGVVVFFMLTGYLFWGKARTAGGRMNPIKLWKGRVFRIAPLYLFSIIGLLAVATFRYGPHILAMENWKSLARLATLGFGRWPLLGTDNLEEINARVVWTLWFEWRFYLVLPFVAWFAIGRRTFGLALVVFAAATFGWYQGMYFKVQLWMVFVLGMLCPVLLHELHSRAALRRPILTLGVIGFAAGVWAVQGFSDGYLILGGALFPLFLLVAGGNTLFGFLTHPAIRFLGAISYSLYLLHGIVYYLVTFIFRKTGMVETLKDHYWLVIILTGVATTGLCSFTFRWIEFPFLSKRRPMDRIPSP